VDKEALARGGPMAIYLVTRHAGAVEWLHSQGVSADETVSHLDLSRIKKGDTFIGTLPIHLAADVYARGAHYFHISVDLPPSLRGKELSAETLSSLGARLEAFTVIRKTS
jgi:CRISPR-associated protein Csx16